VWCIRPAASALDSGGGAFWVPAPATPGRYIARFDLYTPKGTILASLPTEEFRVG
jgi:hypothetical protein